MGLQARISDDLKSAMKSGQRARAELFSYLRSQIHNKEIELGKQKEGLSDEEIVAILISEVKRRKESQTEFKKGGREDLVQKEAAEQKIIEEYLPPQVSSDEIRAELEKVLAEAGSRAKKDFGMLMGKAMARLKGRADGDAVRAELEKLLE